MKDIIDATRDMTPQTITVALVSFEPVPPLEAISIVKHFGRCPALEYRVLQGPTMEMIDTKVRPQASIDGDVFKPRLKECKVVLQTFDRCCE